MKNCQDILDEADTTDVLIAVITVIKVISQINREVFATYFKVIIYCNVIFSNH